MEALFGRSSSTSLDSRKLLDPHLLLILSIYSACVTLLMDRWFPELLCSCSSSLDV